MLIQEQAILYMKQATSRRRGPISLSTKKAYESYLKNWIIPYVGTVDLANFDNRAMKEFVQVLAKDQKGKELEESGISSGSLGKRGLSAATIAGITNCVKDLIKSCQDSNGNVLYPKIWNADFIDAPVLDPKLQNAPVIGQEGLQEAIRRAPEQYKALYTLLAGTGLRISESLALQSGKDNGINSFHLPERSLLVIRDQFKHGQLGSPKTDAGVREIDLAPELNTLLCNESPLLGGFCFRSESGGPACAATLYKLNDKIGIPGFHSLRRFRVSHLRSVGAPEEIIKYWIGHSMTKDITDRYSKLNQNVELRKQWAEKAGLGFQL